MEYPDKVLIRPETTRDGAGVVLKRAIGTPRLDYVDPFLLLDHFGSENEEDYIAGFPMHPHRGIETVTYVLRGSISHRDSTGNEGVITSGGVQWMTAGSGIMHEEMPKREGGLLEGFQLWINLPAASKMTSPRYREVSAEEIPRIELPGDEVVKVIAGRYREVEGPVRGIDADPGYFDVELPRGGNFEHGHPEEHSSFVYVYEGSLEIQVRGEVFEGRSPVLMLPGGAGAVRAKAGKSGARFLYAHAKPLNEPVARYGPFVMNTKAEIQTALKELRDGTFVK